MKDHRSLKDVLFCATITLLAVFLITKAINYYKDPISRITNATAWSVVQVTDELRSAGGTAFAVKAKSGNMFLVTNDHVCYASQTGTMLFSLDAVSYQAKIVEHYSSHDLCLLKVLKESKLVPLKVASSQPVYDDKVYSAGYPMMPYLTVFEGQYKGPIEFSIPMDVAPENCKGKKFDNISAQLPELFGVPGISVPVCMMHGDAILTTLHADFGSSGSPLLNSNVEVVGVIFLTRGNVALGSAVPLEFLQDLLSKH